MKQATGWIFGFWLGAQLMLPVVAGPLMDYFQKDIKSHRLNPGLQGVLLTDMQGNVLEGYQDGRPLPAASVTKLATTLAALDRWGPNHQFQTQIYRTGPIVEGVVEGDILILGGADPFFLWEDGFSLGHRLGTLGIHTITGNVIVAGPFWMNLSANPAASARTLHIALNRKLWNSFVHKRAARWTAQTGLTPTPIQIQGTLRTSVMPLDGAGLPLPPAGLELVLTYPSQPLWKIAKRMNAYSSNPLANLIGMTSGGVGQMAQHFQTGYNLGTHVKLTTASGLGRENKFSPQAVTFILTALEQRLQAVGLQLGDVMAVKGSDPGTLAHRGMPTGVIAKTGTLNGVSCLAGVVETANLGPLRFVLLNQGNVQTLRKLQDRFLKAVQTVYGKPTTYPFMSSGWRDGRTDPLPTVLIEPTVDSEIPKVDSSR